MTLRILKDVNKTVNANSRLELLKWRGKGKIYLTSFVANTNSDVFIVLQVDGGEKIYLPDPNFLYSLGLTTKNNEIFVHIYSDTDSSYGYTIEREIKFKERILIEIYNENDSPITVKAYMIMLEEE